jgi:hypothetical protein
MDVSLRLYYQAAAARYYAQRHVLALDTLTQN